MSGHGGYKHRKRSLKQKRTQARRQGRENVLRVRKMFEEKGQAWDPAKNPVQATALNHSGRRYVGVKIAK
jgi:hypothetical protein